MSGRKIKIIANGANQIVIAGVYVYDKKGNIVSKYI
jgi:hypothetical protein